MDKRTKSLMRRRRLRAERPRTTRFQSETSDREYITTHRRQPDPVAACNCPGFVSHGHCWHQEEVLGKDYDMTTALQPYRVQPPAALLPTTQDLKMIQAIAATAGRETSLVPKVAGKPMTQGQAAVIMLYGRELGVQPMAALNQIYVVNGRPQASAQLMTGLMQGADPDAGVEILERTTEKARVRITYKGRKQTFEATIEDAKRANLTKNPTWSTYPKQMLVWTAVRTGVRLMAPDALNALAQLPAVGDAEAMFPPAEEEGVIEGEAVDVSDVTVEPSLTEEAEADIAPEPEAAPAEDIGKLRNQAGKAFSDFAELRDMKTAIEYVQGMNGSAIVDGNLKLGNLTEENCKELIDAAYTAGGDQRELANA